MPRHWTSLTVGFYDDGPDADTVRQTFANIVGWNVTLTFHTGALEYLRYPDGRMDVRVLGFEDGPEEDDWVPRLVCQETDGIDLFGNRMEIPFYKIESITIY